MTQIRPRLDEDTAAAVQAYADSYGVSFNGGLKILIWAGLRVSELGPLDASRPAEDGRQLIARVRQEGDKP